MTDFEWDDAETDRPGSELIYRAATGLERALADTEAEKLVGIDAELIVRNWSPNDVLLRNVPFLAWALGVTLWRADWPEATKRRWMARQWDFKALRGTEAAIRMALGIISEFGGQVELVDLVVPPQRTFASANITKEQMAAWLAKMPQMRVYLGSETGDGEGLYFIGENAFYGDAFGEFDAGLAIYGRRARVRYPDGHEEPVRVSVISETVVGGVRKVIERAHVPGIGGLDFYGSAFFNDAAYGEEIVEPQIVTYLLDRDYIERTSAIALNAIPPSLDPLDVRYQRTSDVGWGDSCLFVGDFYSPQFFWRMDMGAWLMFDRIYLNDPRVAAPVADAVSFYGHSRYGIPPQWAELMIKVDDQLPRPCAADGDFYGDVFLCADVQPRQNDAMDAVTAAKALRDRTLVTFETTRARTLGDGIPLDGSADFASRVQAVL